MDWEADLAAAAAAGPAVEKRDPFPSPSPAERIFGAKKLKGAPSYASKGHVANPSGSRKRATKNPKYVWNPKAHTSTVATSVKAVETKAAVRSAGNALTDYQDGMRESETRMAGMPRWAGRATADSSLAFSPPIASSRATVWAGTLSIGTPPVDYIIDFDTG